MEHAGNRRIVMLVGAVLLMAVGLGGGYAWGASRDTQHNAASSSASSSGSPSAQSSGSSGSSSVSLGTVMERASATEHNAADVMFAQMMRPHHAQAIEMAGLAATRASSPEVKALARTIEAAQQPEIDTMNGWLSEWDAPAMDTDMPMDHGGMDGMMTQDAMDELASLSGAEFDTAFLTMMIDHHQGAIEMAEDVLRNGRFAETLAMATAIQVTQQAEIAQMQALLR